MNFNNSVFNKICFFSFICDNLIYYDTSSHNYNEFGSIFPPNEYFGKIHLRCTRLIIYLDPNFVVKFFLILSSEIMDR